MATKSNNYLKKFFLFVQKKTGVRWLNSIVYSIALIVSVVLILLYFSKCFSVEWGTLFISLGASGVASVFLAFFIEMSNASVNTAQKNAIRHNKLMPVVKQTEVSTEEIIRFYFEFREDVLNCDDFEKCHIITLPELLVELRILKEKWQHIVETKNDTPENTGKYYELNRNINNWMRGIANKIEYIEESLRLYESQGYFSGKEVSSILHAKKLLGSLNNETDVFNCDKYNGALTHLMAIPEFSYLKDTSFYCKYCCVAIKEYFLAGGFTEEDINEVVTHAQRG